MKIRGLLSVFASHLPVLACVSAIYTTSLPAQAEIQRDFEPVYSSNQRGNLVMTGNTLLTCTVGVRNCAAGQDGTATGGAAGNEYHNMVFVNVDPGAGLTNSSMATLSLPAGATVTWAGLYWQGRGATVPDPGRETLYLRPPGATDYVPVTASQFDLMDPVPSMSTTDPRQAYLAYAEVTAAVSAAGAGEYYAGGLVAEQGRDGHGFFGGWALIVAYQLATEQLRHLVVYNGAAGVGRGVSPSVSITVTDLLTPVTGSFDAYAGVVIGEGDLSGDGDGLAVNGTSLTNSFNPANNFGNSTITDLTGRISAKNPDYVNQLGVDYDTLAIPSAALGNAATSATITYSSVRTDYQYLQSLFFATDLYLPEMVLEKTATDIDGGDLLVGDVVEYRLMASNIGLDAAVDVVLSDPLPAGTSYVADSLAIVTNAGGTTGAQTATAGDDVAEIVAGTLTAYPGTGGSAGAGGRMAQNTNIELVFSVRVTDPALAGQELVNTAQIAVQAETTGNAVAPLSSTAVLPVYLPPTVTSNWAVEAVPALPGWMLGLLGLGLSMAAFPRLRQGPGLFHR